MSLTNKYRSIRIIFCLFIFVFASGFMIKKDMNNEEQKVLAELDSYYLDIPAEFEYSKEHINLNQYVRKREETSDHDVLVGKLNDSENLHSTGARSALLYVSAVDKYGREYRRTYPSVFTVIDTHDPVIEPGKTEITITEGDTLDLAECIERVYDDVDGDLVSAKEETRGAYWFEGTADSSTPGTYELTLVAEDLNGNKSEQPVTVTVNEKLKPVQNSYSPSYGGGSVNFDNVFAFAYADIDNMVSLLDSDHLILYYGDYFHHNTAAFLNLFWRCTAGTPVTVGGVTYTSGGISHGYITTDMIYYDDGTPSFYLNPVIELITCDGRGGRWILQLY